MAKELTQEEKRAKRNEYARAYYAKNKDRMKAARGKGAKPVAKKNAEKAVEKLAARGEKTVAAAKQLLKDAAETVRGAVKAKDEETAAMALAALGKRAGIAPVNVDGKTILRFSVDGKTVKLPESLAPAAEGPTEDELMAIEETADEDVPVEIAVDPADAAALQDGASEDEIMSQYDEDGDMDPEDEEYGDEEEDEDDDEDEEDEDRPRRRRHDDFDDPFGDDMAAGRADMFREMDAMGVGEEDY